MLSGWSVRGCSPAGVPARLGCHHRATPITSRECVRSLQRAMKLSPALDTSIVAKAANAAVSGINR